VYPRADDGRRERPGAPRADVRRLSKNSAWRRISGRVALKVSAARRVATPSRTNRAPLLIPPRFTIDTPSGVTSRDRLAAVYDFNSAGQDKRSPVFEHEFAIGVPLKLASACQPRSRRAGKARYQACERETLLSADDGASAVTIKVAPALRCAATRGRVDRIAFATASGLRRCRSYT